MFALVLIGMSQLALKVAGVFAIANWLESRRAAPARMMGAMVPAQAVVGAMPVPPPPVVHDVRLAEPQLRTLGELAPMPELTHPDPIKGENTKHTGKSVKKPERPTAPKHVMGKMIRPSESEVIMGDLEF
jgi:hypothetical protein